MHAPRIQRAGLEWLVPPSTSPASLPIKAAVGAQRVTPSHLRIRDEQIQTQAVRKKLRGKLPLHTVPGTIEPRRERSEAALARRNRNYPAADATLARQPDVVEPVSRSLIQSRRRHHRERVVANRDVDDPLLRQRIDTAVSESCAHYGQVFCVDVQ